MSIFFSFCLFIHLFWKALISFLNPGTMLAQQRDTKVLDNNPRQGGANTGDGNMSEGEEGLNQKDHDLWKGFWGLPQNQMVLQKCNQPPPEAACPSGW